jgi:putative GTP pyrophosphokinase
MALESLRRLYPSGAVVDRRRIPSFGYRAIHLVLTRDGRTVEIQLRTRLQHLWALVSEKLSDRVSPELKYGGGPDHVRHLLKDASEFVAELERREAFRDPGLDPDFRALREDVLSMFANIILDGER